VGRWYCGDGLGYNVTFVLAGDGACYLLDPMRPRQCHSPGFASVVHVFRLYLRDLFHCVHSHQHRFVLRSRRLPNRGTWTPRIPDIPEADPVDQILYWRCGNHGSRSANRCISDGPADHLEPGALRRAVSLGCVHWHGIPGGVGRLGDVPDLNRARNHLERVLFVFRLWCCTSATFGEVGIGLHKEHCQRSVLASVRITFRD